MKLLLILLFLSNLVVTRGTTSRSLKGSSRTEDNDSVDERERFLLDTVQVATSFEYSLYFNSDTYNASSANQLVQDAILEAVQKVIEGQHHSNITLENLSTNSSVECTESTLAKYPTFDSCSRVRSELVFDMDPTISADMVERVVIQGIRSFMDEFNVEHSNLRLSFEYPILVAATIEVEMIGVAGTMNSSSDTKLFEETLKSSIGPVMLKHDDPSFELSEVRVLYQESGTYEENGRVRNLQTAGDNYTKATVFLRVICDGSDSCTDETLQQYLEQEGPQMNSDLELALKQAGREQGSDYFSSMSDLYIEAPNMNRTANDDPQENATTQSEGFGGDTPWWIWLLLGINFAILVGCCSWVAVKRSQEPVNMKK